MKNIHAFTETHQSYPGYVSINEEVGRLTITVRGRGSQVPAAIEVNRDQLLAMHADIGAYLAKTAPARVVEEAKPEPKVTKGKA